MVPRDFQFGVEREGAELGANPSRPVDQLGKLTLDAFTDNVEHHLLRRAPQGPPNLVEIFLLHRPTHLVAVLGRTVMRANEGRLDLGLIQLLLAGHEIARHDDEAFVKYRLVRIN